MKKLFSKVKEKSIKFVNGSRIDIIPDLQSVRGGRSNKSDIDTEYTRDEVINSTLEACKNEKDLTVFVITKKKESIVIADFYNRMSSIIESDQYFISFINTNNIRFRNGIRVLNPVTRGGRGTKNTILIMDRIFDKPKYDDYLAILCKAEKCSVYYMDM